MRYWMGMPIAAVIALSACVTINVYFPAAEAKEAAKEFVEKVIGDEMQATPKPGGGGMAMRIPAPEPAPPCADCSIKFDPLMLIGIAPAYAQAPDITLKTPAIQSIQSRDFLVVQVVVLFVSLVFVVMSLLIVGMIVAGLIGAIRNPPPDD